MSKGDAVRGLIAPTVEKFGRVDVLVNNAGIQFTAPVEEFPAEKMGRDPGDQLVGGVPWHRRRRAADEKQGWGRIINIASAHGLVALDPQGRLCRGQAWAGGPDQGGRLETAGTGVTATRSAPGGCDAAWSRSRSPTWRPREDQPGRSEQELLGEKTAVAGISYPEQLGGNVCFPVLAGGRPDHRHRHRGRWRPGPR
jgi:3-hydroxybutyrate dehydrogenase